MEAKSLNQQGENDEDLAQRENDLPWEEQPQRQ
jgi:hypothetical protein